MHRFFAFNDGGAWKVVVNPIIKELNGEPEEKREGCLTWIGSTIVADRWPEIEVSYWSTDGEYTQGLVIDGFEAQVWQHEVDHLNGVEENVVPGDWRTYRRAEKKVGRNEPCPCGSGKKHKKCCG